MRAFQVFYHLKIPIEFYHICTNPRFTFAYFLPTKVGFLQGDTKLLAFLPIFGDSWQMGQVSEWQIVADGDFPNADQKVIWKLTRKIGNVPIRLKQAHFARSIFQDGIISALVVEISPLLSLKIATKRTVSCRDSFAMEGRQKRNFFDEKKSPRCCCSSKIVRCSNACACVPFGRWENNTTTTSTSLLWRIGEKLFLIQFDLCKSESLWQSTALLGCVLIRLSSIKWKCHFILGVRRRCGHHGSQYFINRY